MARCSPGSTFAREYEGTCQVPEVVKELAAGRDATAVWRDEVGGVTFRLGDADEHEREFLKWTPCGNDVDLSAEVDRLAWAVQYTTVPRVLSQVADEHGTWFLSAALPGTSAVEARWHEEHRRIGSVERARDMLADIPPVDELVGCHGDTCAPNTRSRCSRRTAWTRTWSGSASTASCRSCATSGCPAGQSVTDSKAHSKPDSRPGSGSG